MAGPTAWQCLWVLPWGRASLQPPPPPAPQPSYRVGSTLPLVRQSPLTSPDLVLPLVAVGWNPEPGASE